MTTTSDTPAMTPAGWQLHLTGAITAKQAQIAAKITFSDRGYLNGLGEALYLYQHARSAQEYLDTLDACARTDRVTAMRAEERDDLRKACLHRQVSDGLTNAATWYRNHGCPFPG